MTAKITTTATALKANKITFFTRLRQAYIKQQTIRKLSKLDDRILRDLGVDRCDIEFVADKVSKD
jgi:uncharacterized protein YjiS (DUF1127 family)